MKKMMTVVLAAVLAFATAGQASASTLETSGEFRGRYWYLDGFTQQAAKAGTADNNLDFWDSRIRLKMDWKVMEGVSVVARGDILETKWQTTGSSAVPGELHVGDPDTKEIDMDWAYAQFGVGPTTVTLGKQDVSWGSGVYAKSDNRYRAKVATKFDKVSVSLAWDALAENLNAKNLGDDNGFTLGVTFPVGDWSFGVLPILRINDANPAFDAVFYAIDGIASGAIGPAKFTGEIAYGQGEQDFDDPAGDDVDLEAFLAYAGVTMPVGPVSLGAEFAYAQGDDPETDDQEGFVGFDYNSAFWSVVLFNNFDLSGLESNFGSDLGVSNCWAAKLSGTMKLTEKTTLYVAGLYADRNEDVSGLKADTLGTEVDALLFYAVNENVTLQGGVGYLFAGDYYENLYGFDPDDVWGVTAHAVVKF